jgi:O-antigen/teichoic acid export membrane protein
MRNKIVSIVKDGARYGTGYIAQRLIGLFLTPIYTRIFVPADYGVMNIIFTASSLLTTLLSWGLTGSLFRYYHEYDEKGKTDFVSTIQLFRLFTSLVICAVLSIFSIQLSTILLGDSHYYSLLLLSLATVIFSVLWEIPIDILRLRFKALRYNFLQVGSLLLQTSLSIIFVIFLKYGLKGIFLSYMISSVATCILALWMARELIRFRLNFSILRKSFVFGIWLLPEQFSSWLTKSSDRIFLSRYASLSDVGIYSISNQLASILWFITSAFRMAWIPVAYKELSDDESPNFFIKVSRYYTILLSFIVFGCSLFSSDVIYILTPEAYHRAYLYVPILTYGFLFSGLDSMFGENLNFANKTRYRSAASLIGAFVNFGLNFYFIPRYNILGASITTLLAYLVSLLLGYFWSRKFYPRIRYNLLKTFLICGYFVPFIIVGFLIDQRYSLCNIAYKFVIFIVAICGVIAIFLNKEAKKVIVGKFK